MRRVYGWKVTEGLDWERARRLHADESAAQTSKTACELAIASLQSNKVKKVDKTKEKQQKIELCMYMMICVLVQKRAHLGWRTKHQTNQMARGEADFRMNLLKNRNN
jgi:hypothetical protein